MAGESLQVALLTYRGTPTCGGQGVYIRHLSRELVALGHRVEVFSGQPYPVLDAGVELTKVPSLDLYREPDPFRLPWPTEFKTRIDLLEFALMCTGAFPEPLTGSLRTRTRPASVDLDARAPIRHRPRQSGPRSRLDQAARSLAAVEGSGRGDDSSPDHGRPPARHRRGRQSVAPLHQAPVVLLPARCSRRSRVSSTGCSPSPTCRRSTSPARWASRPTGCTWCPLGVDPDVFSPREGRTVPGRIIVVTSADVPLKGLMVLLDALAKLRVERPDAHLVCVGRAKPNGPADQRLTSWAFAAR